MRSTKPAVKALALVLTAALLLSSPGAASYAVAADAVRGSSGKSARSQGAPSSLPALNAPISPLSQPAAVLNLQGSLSGLKPAAPAVAPAAAQQAARPSRAAHPSRLANANVPPALAPAAPLAASPRAAAAIEPAAQAKPAQAIEQLTEALQGAAQALESQGPDAGVKTGADAAFDGFQAPAPQDGAPGGIDDIAAAVAKAKPNLNRYIHENLLGWRKVKGVAYDPTLKSLPLQADSARVIDQISRQFGLVKSELVSLASLYRLTPESPVKDWLAVYDRLQKMNREQFKILDQKKYEGWTSFRDLADKTYAPGWRGALSRVSEVHKYFLGFFVRFPYHLFDTFVFGYFRQNISYRFFHSHENFLDIKSRDEVKAQAKKPYTAQAPEADKRQTQKWLEQALSRHAFNGSGRLAGFKANPVVRGLTQWLVEPLLEPLLNFVVRRLTLAVMSAVAMGILGAFAPALPLSFALTSIPVLGPAILMAAQGVPGFLGMVPYIGPILAPVVAAAMTALVKDLVLGPLLNTLLLSTLLTLPNAVKQKAFALRKMDPTNPLPVGGYFKAFGQAVASASFWRQNLKSFFGMMTVGAEIEGIMTYAGAIDAQVSRVSRPWTGHEFKVFETIGAAVERPQGHSPIPFGGAITWGNILLIKFQDMIGVNISDVVMRALTATKSVVNDSAQNANLNQMSAQDSVAAASQRADSPDYRFDPDLWKKGPEAVLARINELKAQSGGLQREISAVKNHMAELSARLGETEGRIADLKKQSRPITAEELAEYERLLRELEGKRNETYAQSKLAQVHDLRNPQPEDLARLRELKKMQEYYEAILLPPPAGQDAMTSSLAVREASLKALAAHLSTLASGRGAAADAPAAVRIDPATQESIAKLVEQIEQLRGQTKGEMANRDATKALLAVANKSRNAALRDRRDGSEMLEFHKNLSKLATVMDLALSLNEIKAAQDAINQMTALLDNKLEKINAARTVNQNGQAQAGTSRADVEKWREDLRKQIKDDDATKQRIIVNEGKAALAASRIQSAGQDLSGLIAHVNSEDGGAAGDALKEYQRRLDLLPQVVKWRTDGGNPNDPDAFSLKGFKDDLIEVEDYIKQAEDGVSRLRTVPVEYAGVVIIAVPGPEVTVSNPSKDQVLKILADRKVHWQAKRADYQKSLDSVLRRLDPNNSRTVTDEFGDANPESLPRWRAQEAANLAKHQAQAAQYLTQLDAAAAEINRAAGSNIPMLAGMSLTELRGAIKDYGDKLRAVKFPTGDNPDIFKAKMNLVSAAKLLTYSAHEIVHWAKADGYMTEIDKVMADTLPEAKTKLEGVVRMLDDILADVELDRQYVQGGGGDGQALIDRKINLLQVKLLPPLRDAKTLLEKTMMPWQQDSIDSAKDTGIYFELFDNQKTLATEVKKLYERTLPWAFAAYGAKEGDKADGHFWVADFRKTLQDNLNGYDDAKGHNKGIKEYQLEMQQRKDPNYAGTEVLYGEEQPFSLPRKIAKYEAERAQRALEINQQAAEINEILGKIEALSKGKYNLGAYRLPGGVTSDDAGVARVQALVDGGKMRGLADELSRIGNEASAAGNGGISIGAGGGGQTIPSGTQAPISVSDQQQIALLALAAGARLVPSATTQSQPVGPCYNAVARFLFSDGMIGGASDALNVQVPTALKFLDKAAKALSDGIDATARDDAYVDSNGASETPEQVYSRKAAVLGQLAAFLQDGMAFFDVKQGWNQDSFGTIDKVSSYYDSMGDVYDGGLKVNDNEVKAINTMRDALKKTFDDLEATRRKVSTWMGQLNDPNESAMRRVGDSLAEVQEKTRAVLETNIDQHKFSEELARSESMLKSMIIQTDQKQAELLALLDKPGVRYALPDGLTRRIEDLQLNQWAWSMGDKGREPQALVVRKSEFSSFVDSVLAMFQAQNPGMDISAVKADLLKDPKGLAALIPGSAMLDFGDTADGFYMYYKSQFGVPNGLETASWVTLGNVAKVGGNNISIGGHQFSSPPNDVNAPYGDKGVEVQVESLQGGKWVNYLNVGFHRFALDVPADMKMQTQADVSRILMFDDFAMMMMGDRLYVGLAGFADFAAKDSAEKPVYYGGSLKTSFKMTEVMKLTHEQQRIFADDPRKFLQEVNLDFTGYDPDLDKEFDIRAEGEHKRYQRSQSGASFDLGRLMDSREAFTVDVFMSRVSGTDDIGQKAVGATIIKGFTIRNAADKPVVQINNRLTAERGEKYNTWNDRLSVTLPDYGLVISGQGKVLGSARNYYGEVAKKISDRTTSSIGYGSTYAGAKDRLTIAINTEVTMGQIWDSVVKKSGEQLKGGEALKAFDRRMDGFFSGGDEGKPAPSVAALKRVFETDVARKLISQDMGRLTQDIKDLRRAGAFLDNLRIRGMVGFVSNPISNDKTDRAVGAGFVAGTWSELSLSQSQRALIDAKAESLYREGLRLQARMAEMVKEWQSAVTEMAQAQWELKMAEFAVGNSPSDATRREAEVRRAQAVDRLHQALLRYNLLSGRDPEAEPPFRNLAASDLEELLSEIRKTVSGPDRLAAILGSLDKEEIAKQVGKTGFNLMDWLPWVEKFSVGVGTQMQDMMANQILTVGASVRLPIYDPGSKSRDKSYAFERKAALEEMSQVWADHRLAAAQSRENAAALAANAEALAPGLPKAADDLKMAIRAYRNGLIDAGQLREAFASWHWYMSSVLEARSAAALAGSWTGFAQSMAQPASGDTGELKITRLEDAFAAASRSAHSLQEVALRQSAAAEMTKANDHRVQKVMLDLSVGANLTATGVGWIPRVAISGVPVMPMLGFELKPEELRELQAAQGQGQTEYYKQLKTKLEADLAVRFTQNLLTYHTALRAVDLMDRDILPGLERDLTAARARELPGGPDVPVTSAMRRLDEARQQREQAVSAARQARATMNYLLGRPEDAALSVELSGEAALAGLQRILAEKQPVAAQREVLASRVRVAKAVESAVDKDLKVERLAIEPVSLVARSLGRFLQALGDSTPGNPDLVAAARVQTLAEERAAEAFEKDVQAQAAQAQAQLNADEIRLTAIKTREDAAGRLERISLQGRILSMRAVLASLQTAAPRSDGPAGAMPRSMAELYDRLAEAQRRLAAPAPAGQVQLIRPDAVQHDPATFARYYHANSTMDQKTKLNQDFAEGWIELRLKSRDTSPEVLLTLAKLREEKAGRIHRGVMGEAAAQSDLLLARFESDVRMWRWVQEQIRTAGPSGKDRFESFSLELQRDIDAQRDRIAALLGLSAAIEPKILRESLMSLVPADRSGGRDLAAMGEEFLSRARALQIGYVRDAIFDGGLPPAVGGEDNLMQQLSADTIARRMSYKGFTPVAAFGVFRGQKVGGLFLDAPDPQAVESGLVNLLSDALRKELQSDGRIKELSLRLNQLMWRVADGARTLEAQRDLVAAAETEYRAKLAQADGPAGWEQARLAQERLASAWLGFGRTMKETQGAFVTLVSELEALGQGRETVERAAGSVFPTQPGKPDAQAELSGYITQRMLDADFAARLDAVLAGLAPGVTAEARRSLADRAVAYRFAARDAEAVMLRDFTPAERIDLLTRNDKEGRRLAVEAELDQVLAALGRLDPHANPAWARLLAFMRDDIAAQAALRGGTRAEEVRVAAAMREAYWHAVPAPFTLEGAFQRLDKLQRDLGEAKQSLLESYLSDLNPAPENFVLKDLLLDAYLKAQAAFDAELIKTFDSKEVRADGAMARGLDGIYDINRTITRVREGVRYGRGMAALDSLLMLGESRLAAERWQGSAPAEIDRAAAAVQSLRDLRARWTSGAVELAPLYAQTRSGPDGRRLWTIDGWLTSQEVKDLAAKGVVKMKDGRMYLEAKGLEIVGGVDAAEEARERAAAAELANRRVLELHAGLQKGDFALVPIPESPAAPEAARQAAAERAVQVRSFAQVFGPGGLAEKGKVIFFDAAPGVNGLHGAAHPLRALERPLEQSVIYVYTGSGDLPPGRYPTLESLRASRESGDFSRLVASERGAQSLMARASERGAAQLRRGWLEVKLGGYGFARDGQGRVVELYLSRDDFEASNQAFRNADRDLRAAEAELAAAQKRLTAAEADAKAKQAEADRVAPEYQRVQAETRARLLEEARAQTSRRSRETDQAYASRVQEALARRMLADRGFSAAKKLFDPAAKAGVDAAAKLREARADVVNKTAARDAAVKLASDSKQWSLYRSADLSLGLGSDGRIVNVTAAPVYGESRFSDDLAESAVVARKISGQLYGAVADGEGRVRRYFTSRGELDKAAQGWTMQTVTVGGSAPTGGADGRSVKSTYRLSHYVDGTVTDETGRPLPVSLSRVFMAEREDGAKDQAGYAKHWSVMPWNWGNLLLELPRGIVGTPVELLTGRDPRQQHYLGRAYMYKTEGGATEHHGLFRKVAGLVDVLDLLPDRVERYYDPSQFPSEVRLNSRIQPGENIFDKRARDPKTGNNVHFGAVYAQRSAGQAVEDVLAARERTLSRFYGGAEEVIIETRRGRAGPYEQSRVRGVHGADALDRLLAQDGYVAGSPYSDGTGREVVLAAEPGNLAVDRVERRVRVNAGAAQYAKQAGALRGYSEVLARQAQDARSQESALREGLAKSESEFAAAQALREKVAAEEDALWRRFHALAWRIAAQKALEAEIARLEAEAAALRTELAWWRGYLKRLEDALTHGPIVTPPGPPVPTPVPPQVPNQFWAWVLALSALAAILSALFHWLLSKRNALIP